MFQIQWPWMPSLDLYLRFRLDGLSLLFGLIITGAGFFVTVYSSSYMSHSPHTGRFFFFLHAFMVSMLGIVMADNLLLLFVFWEATTVFSYLLIGFEHTVAASRDSARQAILITGAGGLSLLIGILLLKMAGGSFTLSQWIEGGGNIRDHALYPFIFTAVLLGAMTKSAQFPFHFWLPNAMSAPTPISAFLHAATMVKAGIYLLMRFHPLLGGTTLWMSSLVVIGGVTALWGAVQALGPCDMKRVLAYTTMMALGTLTMFLGGTSAATLTAAATFLLVHALYKAALFLAVGSIDHEAGTRQLDQLGGLMRHMPLTALAVAAAAMSMAGFPLFFGFIGKEIMYKGALAQEMFPVFATTMALLSNALMTAVSGILIMRPFTGKLPQNLGQVCEAPWTMRLGPNILGSLGIVFGIIPWWVSENLIQPAVFAIHPAREKIELALFHGINPPLILSMITLTLGVTIYLLRRPAMSVVDAVMARMPISSQKVYQWALDGFLSGSGAVTGRIQNGRLHQYLAIIILALVSAVGWSWFKNMPEIFQNLEFDGRLTAGGLVILIAAAAIVVVTARKRLAAICGLGGVGAGVALIFLVYGAPDIALTQLLVETLTVIIVSLILLRLPPLKLPKKVRLSRRIVDIALSLTTGLLITTLLIAVVNREPLDLSLTTFYEAQSYLVAHGRNIVNVIIVDFRALDTLGEITVVVLAAWAALALIRGPLARTEGRK